jgi:FkbM family methyltransferase
MIKFPNNNKYLERFEEGCKGLYEPDSGIRGQWRSKNGYQGNLLTQDLINRISELINFDDINVVFDIGSRDALQSVEFAMWFPSAKVYAFEANPNAIDLCTKTLDHYKDNSVNIEIIPYACHNHNGNVSFYPVYNGNVGASSLLETSNHSRSRTWKQKKITVKCVRVDEWCKKNNIDKIDILWMDVQGAEKMVLEGIGDMLSDVKIIQTEIGLQELYKGQMMKKYLDEYLEKYGFEMLHGTNVGGDTEMDVIYINTNIIKNDSKYNI